MVDDDDVVEKSDADDVCRGNNNKGVPSAEERTTRDRVN